MHDNWVAIFGKIDYSDGVIRHIPTPAEPPSDPSSQALVPHSLIRSNIEFEQGTITLEALIQDPDARCQIGLPGRASGDVYAGLNALGATYGFGIFRNGNWEPGGGAGYGDRPPTNKWITLGLTVRGSTLELTFDGVKVSSTVQRIQKGPISLFLQSHREILVRNVRVEAKRPECFVVMQFTEEYNALFTEVLRPTCEKFGYLVVRADDFYTSGMIIDDITRSISESALVIADVTPNNPNVFYEVGYAHGIGKPTILLSDRKRDRLPFDISGFRTLFYDNTIGGKTAVEERLTKHLEAIGA
jgi:hypothetical protein